MIMRLVTRKIATYQEIMTYWDLYEVLETNEWLDMQDDAEWLAGEEMRRKMKGTG